MTLSDILSDLPLGPGDRREQLLQFRLQMAYLADHVYSAELADGGRVRDAMDFVQLLRDLADETRKVLQIPDNTKVSAGAGNGTCRTVTRPAQPRWNEGSGFHDPTCPRCGHVHEGVGECGVSMGKDRLCRCDLEVSA
jgi:hypothetical protein